MRYETYKTVGQLTETQEYEGTPAEIAELIRSLNENEAKVLAPTVNVSVETASDIDKIARKLNDGMYQTMKHNS